MQDYLLPHTARVTELRGEIQSRLFTSLHHIIFDVLVTKFGSPITEAELRSFIFDGEKYPGPTLFALHGALLKAVLDDDTSEIPELFRIIKTIQEWNYWAPHSFSTKPLSEDVLHKDEVFLLKRAFADDVGLTTALVAPQHSDVERGAMLITGALDILKQSAPTWSEELSLLANQIYFAVGDTESGLRFGGAAVFDAFGSILMNPLGFQSVEAVLMAFVHESSHQQMFLYHLNDPILLNDASAVYTSPLRKQPRPMEGIFHAMWVSARMTVAAEAVLSAAHDVPWKSDLRAQQIRAYDAFRDCEQTVAEHAKLTEFGQDLFDSARVTLDGL
ncbi:MAG: HEXXH motif-containing putative peptide modification protein [Pseudoruegeria sp.]